MTRTMVLDVTVHSDESCFDLPAWRALVEADANRHIFATPEWNRVWWEEFGEGKDLFILTMGRGEDVAALCPLYRKREDSRAILRFVGGIDLTDYLGPICSPDERDEVAASLVAWLAEDELEWDEFDAHNMPVPLGFADFLVDHADRRGFSVNVDQEETSAVLSLPGDWEGYLSALGSKDRHELRRKRRRLEREHPDAVVRTTNEETLDQDLKLFVEMHRGAEGHKGHFMKPERATFFERVAHAFSELGWLRMDFLEIGGRPVASTFAFETDGTYYLYNSSYEPDSARLSPGLVLVSELVKDAIERGLVRFDFLRGPERYKYQLGAEAVPLNNVRIANSKTRPT